MESGLRHELPNLGWAAGKSEARTIKPNRRPGLHRRAAILESKLHDVERRGLVANFGPLARACHHRSPERAQTMVVTDDGTDLHRVEAEVTGGRNESCRSVMIKIRLEHEHDGIKNGTRHVRELAASRAGDQLRDSWWSEVGGEIAETLHGRTNPAWQAGHCLEDRNIWLAL